MNTNNYSLRYRKFLRDVLGDECYSRMPNEFLPDVEKTLDEIFQGIPLNDADKTIADMFHVQPEQVTSEMRRVAREIRSIRNSKTGG